MCFTDLLVGTLLAVFSRASAWLAINVGKDAAILVGKAVLAHAAILADTVTLVAVTTLADEPTPAGTATLAGKPFPAVAAIPAEARKQPRS